MPTHRSGLIQKHPYARVVTVSNNGYLGTFTPIATSLIAEAEFIASLNAYI